MPAGPAHFCPRRGRGTKQKPDPRSRSPGTAALAATPGGSTRSVRGAGTKVTARSLPDAVQSAVKTKPVHQRSEDEIESAPSEAERMDQQCTGRLRGHRSWSQAADGGEQGGEWVRVRLLPVGSVTCCGERTATAAPRPGRGGAASRGPCAAGGRGGGLGRRHGKQPERHDQQ